MDTTLKLQTRPANRVAAAMGALCASALEALWAVILISSPNHPHGWGWRGLLFVVLMAVGTGYFIVRMLKLVFARPPTLTVTDEALVITHANELKRSLVVPREQVRAVSVRTGDSPSWWEPFEFEPAFDSLDEQSGVVLPLLASDPNVNTNVLVLLEKPLNLYDHKRRAWTDLELHGFRPTRPPQRSAFVLAVSNVDGALRAFERWGVVRKLEASDTAAVAPTRAQMHRYRLRNLAMYAGLAYCAVALVKGLLGVLFK